MSPITRGLVLAIVLLTLGACGSPDAVPGSTPPTTVPSTTASSATTTPTTASTPSTTPVVPAAALDLGEFTATASKVQAVVASEEAGEVAEAYRLAEYVVDPYDFDRTLTKLGPPSTVIADGKTLSDMYYFTAPLEEWVTGFGATRRTETPADEVSSSVLLFRSPAEAAKAARGLHAKHLEPTSETDQRGRKIVLPAHPRALVAAETNSDERDVTAVESSGRGLLIVYALSKTKSFATLQTVVANVLARQKQLFGEFKGAASLTALPVDPKGLLGKTLAVDAKGSLASWAFSGGPLTATHFFTEPQGVIGLLRAAEVDAIAANRATVLRAGSPPQAERLNTDLAAVAEHAYAVAAPPKGLGQAACFSLKLGKPGLRAGFSCQVAVDRYVAQASGTSLLEVQQLISAQYLVLTGG